MRGLAEGLDLGPLVGEEELEQLLQPGHVVHEATDHFLPVLDEDRLARVLEDDVGLGVARAEFLLDRFVEAVPGVLRLPIAERHAQGVHERAVDVAPLFRGRRHLVLGNEGEVVRARPTLQQVLERLAHHALASRPGDLLQGLELIEVLLDEELAHRAAPALRIPLPSPCAPQIAVKRDGRQPDAGRIEAVGPRVGRCDRSRDRSGARPLSRTCLRISFHAAVQRPASCRFRTIFFTSASDARSRPWRS